MVENLLRRALVPVSSLEDTQATCKALRSRLDDAVEDVIVLHVIQHNEGYIDRSAPDHLREKADEMFAEARILLDIGASLETELRFGTDVVDEIKQSALDHDATAIVFRPRPKGRLSRLLMGATEHRLLAEAPCPVIALPTDDEGGSPP